MKTFGWECFSLERGANREIWIGGEKLYGISDRVGFEIFVSWWKTIVSLGEGVGNCWFNSEVVRRVGNGASTSFWNVAWRGALTFRAKYPRLYSISNQQEACVREIGGSGEWLFEWRRRFFQWEEHLFNLLKEELEGVVWSPGDEDRWFWKLTEDGVFSVKSTYEKLIGLLIVEDRWWEDEKMVFGGISKSAAPLKVIVFSWKALLNRIPTKSNLRIRNVIPADASSLCVGCGRVDETSVHLLLHCDLAIEVWGRVMRWWNFSMVTPPNLFVHWACWNAMESRKKLKKVLRLVWHAAIWVLWKAQNNSIFNNGIGCSEELAEEIKVLSWRWAMHRVHMYPCLFYEWLWNTRDCSLR